MLVTSQASVNRRFRSKSFGLFDFVDNISPVDSTKPSHRKNLSFADFNPLIFENKLAYKQHLRKDVEEQTEYKDVEEKAEAIAQPEVCWDRKRVWEWYDSLPWLAGMNYLPRYAVNFVEMWDESSFDIQVIEEELIWAAEKLGYNTLRTNIPMVLYEADAAGLTSRVNLFLKIAAKHGFGTMLCPMDDCEFSGEPAKAGPQPDPVPGLHNSRAVGSPGRNIVCDKTQWYRIEEYIKYVVRTWGNDKRVILLDLYNEPGNPWIFELGGTRIVDYVELFEERAYELMERVFAWAREMNPTQPLSISAWHMPDPFFDAGVIPLKHRIDQRAMELSDVITVHAYCDPLCLQNTLKEITIYGKPILLTEWMARQVQSTYDSSLPTLKELRVGAYQWGLVKGKSQTYLPWPHVANKYEGDPMWWHDVLDEYGNYHNEKEGEIIRSFLFPQKRAISSSCLLSDHVSESNLEHAHSSAHLFRMQQSVVDTEEFDHSGQEQQPVMPSVCSFSMAQINAVAASAGIEQFEKESLSLDQSNNCMPTFGAQMHSPTIEGLDLEVQGGIEF